MTTSAIRAVAAVCASLLVLSGTLLPAGGSDAARLIVYPYRDDFDQQTNWSVVQGAWRRHDGLYNGSGDDARTMAGNASWEDLDITGRFRIAAGNVAAILFRSSGVVYEENSGRLFQIENSATAGVSISHTSLGSKTTDASASYSLDRGAWYSFKISVRGSRVDYYINGSAVVNFTNVVYAAGQFGLRAYKSTCHFDDLSVRDPAGALLFGDDFSKDADGGWEARSGTWAFGGGACTMVSGADGRDLAVCPAPAPDQSWTARTQLMWTAGTSFETGMYFNYTDPANNYLVLLSAGDDTLRIRRTESGAVSEKWASRGFPVNKGDWYTFTVVFNGTGFGVYVNTALLLNKTDPSPLPGTGLGLGSRSASQERCRFEYFEVFEGELPPRPDLSVNLSALYVDPARPNPGETVDIRVNIDNTGTLDAAGNYSVELLAGDLGLEIALPAAIPAGKTAGLWFHWTANLTGNLTLTVAVDRPRSVVELDDNNNNASFTLYVNIPPAAAISVDPPDGRPFVEQTVHFNGTGSSDPDGSVASYLWSFGDRTFASTATASHVYKSDGTYTISLNVTDDGGAWAVTSTRITVQNRVPSANLSWTPSGGDITTNFTFRYTLYDPDRTLSGVRWDFGDGQNTTDQSPTHRYADDRTYELTFTVFYNSGRENVSFTAPVTVQNIPPKAVITSAPTELRKLQTGVFKASATDPDDLAPLRFSWDFGDGTNASGAEAPKSFNRSGTYRVTLSVLDEHGLNSTAFVLVKVPNAPPYAAFAGPPPAYLNETFRFDASFSTDADGVIRSYSWDFGDGSKGSGMLTEHNYSAPGNYTVRLTVADEEGANSTAQATVWVREIPSAPRPPAVEEPESPVAAIGILLVAVFAVVIGILLWSRARRREQSAGAPAREEQGPGGFQI